MKQVVGVLAVLFLSGCSHFAKLSKLTSTPTTPPPTRGLFTEKGISFYLEDFDSRVKLADAARHMTRHAMYREGAKLYRTPHGVYVVSKKGAQITGYSSTPAIPVWMSAECEKGDCLTSLRSVSNSAASTLCDGGVQEEIKPIKGIIDLNGRLQFDLPAGWFTMEELLGSSPSNILVTVTLKGGSRALCNIRIAKAIEPSGEFKHTRLKVSKKRGSLLSLQSDKSQEVGFGFQTKAGYVLIYLIQGEARQLADVEALAKFFLAQRK